MIDDSLDTSELDIETRFSAADSPRVDVAASTAFKPLTEEYLAQIPPKAREYAIQVHALACKVVDLANAAGQSQAVVLQALLNAYVSAGESYGRAGEVGMAMLQIGGQLVMRNSVVVAQLEQVATDLEAEARGPVQPGKLH